jgi:hypothetical protein
MPDGSSSAVGDVGLAWTGSRITRAMQPSAAGGETVVLVLWEQRRSLSVWRHRDVRIAHVAMPAPAEAEQPIEPPQRFWGTAPPYAAIYLRARPDHQRQVGGDERATGPQGQKPGRLQVAADQATPQ